MRERRYTIAEIREYFSGCILQQAKSRRAMLGKSDDWTDDLPHNVALKYALHDLEDYQDGIDAVLLRRKKS